MSGIYIHIPFCKQACHYCDFHFSTSLKKKDELIQALAAELQMRKIEFQNTIVDTIYFGGGTPSLLSNEELQFIIDAVYSNYQVSEVPEITLEANPDDLTKERIQLLAQTPINRLSIGIQSFFETDLQLMNRAHNAEEAENCLQVARRYFDNITIDLIYGIPGLSNERWKENIDMALRYDIPHISSYALTVEPKTALEHLIKKGEIKNVDDDAAQVQFHMLTDRLEAEGFVHYELSNFGKEGFFSRNNSAYWLGKSYIGIGPSAHSFNGNERSWNVRNNSKYINAIASSRLPMETETLTVTDKYNEYVMTGLRTVWGVSIHKVSKDFGKTYKDHLLLQADSFINQQLLYINDEKIMVTKKGKFLCDGIASELFMLNNS
ncbi:oxygen-independent coproporphyrinogen-3 oxidase [Formosa sp. Hel1_31_208]|uniref:radical SAM family heme chaperone HemW n=1 Tax=Formosa sp. Hel1_31_208 TaxID=1798225 RepID=UPI00087A92A6|nr:radical SAM family heme chaperone HemW [Formosa sp. Hel1_31_208]SDR85956.1 oxygen-independent coproporphyrinogen-3 oxidase [Formosa sp. Hel1_31_208]